MWYVIQVFIGTEENVKCQCESKISQDILQQCFIPYYEEKRKYQGQWHTQKKILFPGYVFLVSDNVERLFEALKCITAWTKMIGTGREVVPLSDSEAALLERMVNKDKVVEMSLGVIENDEVRILQGPLQEMEGTIRKIDRHKRIAWLEIEMFGRTVNMQVGCEIVEKK